MGEAQVPLENAQWWFGIYSGIDSKTNTIHPNLLIQCALREYPITTPSGVVECIKVVYLPLIQGDAAAATGQ